MKKELIIILAIAIALVYFREYKVVEWIMQVVKIFGEQIFENIKRGMEI